jgi:hypothetical protein
MPAESEPRPGREAIVDEGVTMDLPTGPAQSTEDDQSSVQSDEPPRKSTIELIGKSVVNPGWKSRSVKRYTSASRQNFRASYRSRHSE